MKLLVTIFALALVSNVFANGSVAKPATAAAAATSKLGEVAGNKVDCSTISNRTVVNPQPQGEIKQGTPNSQAIGR